MKRVLFPILCAIALIFATPSAAQQKHNVRTPQDPATLQLPENRQGYIIDGTIENSQIYPGTKRDFQVFIPKQYDGQSAACLVVGLDGNLFNAITVMGNLINSGEMPVCIGIFLQPGTNYHNDGSLARYNRSNEFDSTNDRLASFIEKEVIPLVEQMTTPDGKPIIISPNPNDRAITGASSSGIAAFTVAWERPDLFRRVYSSVGTFVAMRGGNEYPAIIRKTESKPLRIFLQDGVNDTWNYIFGDWWEQNQLMASALNFAGYELDCKWDRGSHSIYYGTRIYPDAMRWLWRGWPAEVEAGNTMNELLVSLLPEGEQWSEVTPQDDADFPQEVAKAMNLSGIYNKQVKDTYKELVLYNGDSYISTGAGEIFLLKKGSKRAKRLDIIENSGAEIAIYPNNRILVATEKNSNWLISYMIDEDGSLKNGQRFYWLHNTSNHTLIPYGNITFDTLGNLFIATPLGIQICDQNGRVRGILPSPCSNRIDAICFIGNTLYAKCGRRLFVRKLAHTGHNCWDKPIEVKSQGQG